MKGSLNGETPDGQQGFKPWDPVTWFSVGHNSNPMGPLHTVQQLVLVRTLCMYHLMTLR